MSSVFLAVSISLLYSMPPAKLQASATSPLARVQQGDLIIAQQYGDSDPHGNDPHGGDPRGEVHDWGLKANVEDGRRQAPADVYGGKAPGANSQHPLDNFPGQPGF